MSSGSDAICAPRVCERRVSKPRATNKHTMNTGYIVTDGMNRILDCCRWFR